ncbi:MAG: PepSY-associated TM helix domain-containing protein [Thermoanaerobaculia bacterium]
MGARDGARQAGKAVTGGANLLFVVVLLSGLYLWIPRRLAGGKLRSAVWFRRGLSPKARDFNWHHVFGVWALVPLLVMVVSALPMSYRWAGDTLTRITGGVVNRSPESRERAPRPETPRLADLDLRGIDLALERARNEAPDWNTLSVRLPSSEPGSIAVAVDRSGHRGRPDLRTQISVDRERRRRRARSVRRRDPRPARTLLDALAAHRRGGWLDRPGGGGARLRRHAPPRLDRLRARLAPIPPGAAGSPDGARELPQRQPPLPLPRIRPRAWRISP